MVKGARALGKIVATITGKIGNMSGQCAEYGTNAVYAVIRHVITSKYKKYFKKL